MKRYYIIILMSLLMSLAAFAQNRVVERTYLSTDRAVYVAGDDVWCSAFCLDMKAGGELSSFSSIAYVEMIGESGQVATAKVALQNGRGAARFHIPASTPTGNYRLVAYTGVNRNETGLDYLKGSKVISVFNTMTNLRSGSTSLGPAPAPSVSEVKEDASALKVEKDENGNLVLSNDGDNALSFSLSVYSKDMIVEPASTEITEFAGIASKSSGFTADYVPEYDGEIIRVQLPVSCALKPAFISSPGNQTNFYSTDVDSTGLAVFYTGNIYGETNMVFQVDDDEAGEYTPQVLSPFVTPAVTKADLPVLYMDEAYADDLLRRSVSMQLAGKFGTEVLTDRIPERPNLLFSASKMISYKLDDYTRFPTMRETVFEFVKEISIRKLNGKPHFKMEIRDEVTYNRDQSPYAEITLTMLDGIPVTDQSLIVDMDPSLIKIIDIFPYPVATGCRIFGGVINFRTYRGDMSGLKFPDSVKMLDFSGCCYPAAIREKGLDDTYPDYRQTLVWEPLIDLKPGESITVGCHRPAYDSDFIVKVEGISSVGCPFVAKKMF